MNLGSVMVPVDRFIHVANNKILKSLVLGAKFNEFTHGVPLVRQQFSDRLADAFCDAAIIALGKLFVKAVNGMPRLERVGLTVCPFRIFICTRLFLRSCCSRTYSAGYDCCR